MAAFTEAESLHRLVKAALDSGQATSLEAAQAQFAGYRLVVSIDSSVASSSGHQAALLTVVALGSRVFLGGVTVAGELDFALKVQMPLGPTLLDAVRALGGKPGQVEDGVPCIAVSPNPSPKHTGFAVRTVFAGWRGGIVPLDSVLTPAPGPEHPLAAMLAAALAVNEAFLSVSGRSPTVGRQAVGLSLWQPKASSTWLDADPSEPALQYLPSRLWLLGLGHLGQAYLWGLGLLPFPNPAEVNLVLQDVDVATPSTQSTSVLTSAQMVGRKKTRLMADWADRRGFETAIVERYFDKNCRRHDDEPSVALCGLDNAIGRQALDRVGFDLVVEAGLGRGHRDFRTMRLHVLPGARSAVEIWKVQPVGESTEQQAAYQKLLKAGLLDKCGVTLLAGKAVGAPFVGAVAACLALSEVIRLLHGGSLHSLIDLDLLSIDQRTVVSHPDSFHHLNPGYSSIA